MKLTKIVIFLWLLLAGMMGMAQTSTQGTEFWVSFMSNASIPEIKLIVSANAACTGTVTNPNTGWSTSFSVSDYGLTNVVIPVEQAYATSSETIETKGLKVTTTQPVSLFASNFYDYSFDAANVHPTAILASAYMVQSYPDNFYRSSEFLIVATEDNTIVNITPTAQTRGNHAANTTFSVELCQGDVYQVKTINEDLSGSTIVAQNGKKIAVFNGNVCVFVPNDERACDHIVEQTFPTDCWGTEFAVTATYGRNTDQVRVTALENNTTILKNNSLVATINSGETYEFTLSATETSCFLKTSQPAAVNVYFTGGTVNNTMGDPSMTWIAPIEQKMNDVTFGTFQTAITRNHYVNIVTATEDVASVRLNGVDISNRFSLLAGNADLSFARISIPYGTFRLQNENGFLAHVYGVGIWESYSYSVGSNALNLTTQMLVNDIQSIYIPQDEQFCPNEEIVFECVVNYAYNNIFWDFGDGNTATGSPVTHSYDTVGIDTVSMIVERQVPYNNQLYDTVKVILNVVNPQIVFLSDAICEGEDYLEYGFNILQPEAGTVFDTLITEYLQDCDTAYYLTLTVYPDFSLSSEIEGDATPCMGTIAVYRIPNAAGIQTCVWTVPTGAVIAGGQNTPEVAVQFSADAQAGTISVLAANACGSGTLSFAVTPSPSYHIAIDDTLCIPAEYHNYGFDLPIHDSAGYYYYTQNYTTATGCDSVRTLILYVFDNPSVTITGDSVICSGETTTLHALGEGATISGGGTPPPVAIGDILCTDNTTVKPNAFAASGKTAKGVVFYVDATGWHGWAAALEDACNECRWGPYYYYSYTSSDDVPEITNCTNPLQAGTDFNGMENTLAIQTHYGSNFSNCEAAYSCYYYDHATGNVGSTHRGWYLPAAGQLRKLYSTIHILNPSIALVGGTVFTTSFYLWSSSEYSFDGAWGVRYTGNVVSYYKGNYNNFYGRAVCAF